LLSIVPDSEITEEENKREIYGMDQSDSLPWRNNLFEEKKAVEPS
jgi:hypothetical protein